MPCLDVHATPARFRTAREGFILNLLHCFATFKAVFAQSKYPKKVEKICSCRNTRTNGREGKERQDGAAVQKWEPREPSRREGAGRPRPTRATPSTPIKYFAN